jgi:hypothetical protein
LARDPPAFHADLELLFATGKGAVPLARLSGGLGALECALRPEQRAALETVSWSDKRENML